MSRLTQKLCQAVWDEISPILENYDMPDVCEAQLMAYFPELKISTLFGTTFIGNGKPLNFIPYAQSFLLLEEDLPEQKLFYCFVVLRRPLKDGIRLDYLFPYVEWDDAVRVEKIKVLVNDEKGREQVIAAELKMPKYAKEWIDYYEPI
jgi:hypothetical protein